MSGLRALVVSAAAAVVFPAWAQSDPFPVNRHPGTLVYWFTGTGTFPQSAMPYGRFTKVDGRWIRLIALREDGAALSFRAESWGGTSSDFNLRPGPYRDVKISDNMLLLKKSDSRWDAFFPPNEGGGAFNPPIPPLPFSNADCALYYGAGLDFDGQIWAWGSNNFGQSDCPPGPFVDVACLQRTTAGLRPDGTVELWGQHAGVIDAPDVIKIKSGVDSLYGQTATGEIVCLRACSPESLPGEPVGDFDPRDGDSGLAWILPDGRGSMSPGVVPETRWQDITTTVGGGEALGVVDTDCDGSGFFDRGEIAAGLISDCNGNLVPDSCETARHVVRTAEWLGQLVGGQTVSLRFTALEGGQAVTVSITPSLPVTSKTCTDGGLWLRLEYVAAAPDDCNGNGIDDACEIVSGTVSDDDGDGVPDGCGEACLGDLDGDSAVGGADLAVLLSAWGQKGDTDLTGDGTTDGADLASLLSAWGACP
jgi:hypothetical protein